MRVARFFLVVLLVLVVAMTGCKKDDNGNDNPTGPNTNTGDFAVNVSGGVNPQYSWTAGNAFSVSVVRTSAPTTVVWGIATPGQDNISSPVTHGTVPAGAVETFPTEKTLTAGVEYRVSITKLTGETGWTVFTP